MEIRQATEADLISIQNIAHIAWHTTYECILRPDTRASVLAEFYDEANLLHSLHRPGVVFYVAEVEGKVIGFAQALPRSRKGGYELARIYILPGWQRQGVGTALLEAIEARIPGQRLGVFVEHENQAALAFCRARGFEPVRNIELPLYSEMVSFIELRKQL
ncbi:MAG: GNAT family N-acetyltransferase [Bacillota bacterium]|jgi:ribosomal protein S18 acetylase RimI-like enzyme